MKIRDITRGRAAVMGILNVTEDSFYDGGKYLEQGPAAARAREMLAEGADIIDVGGESTRPGARGISGEEEISRVIPVIDMIAGETGAKISCDTSKRRVAEEALKHGAVMINDVTGFADPGMRKTAAAYDAAVCIMHMRGTPRDMQDDPSYEDVLPEIRDFLYERAALCEGDGISPENIMIDPGIGFGKTLEHNLKILANIEYFCGRYPVMIGASRKSFLQMLLGIPKQERLSGSVAAAVYSAMGGASVLRVHDVKETKEALRLVEALREKRNERDTVNT
ncbi:MAG: dihydropteroate synthase [Elusimicrobia bacterium]|nr:dihydropteroate synthase [Elusimicrobiota bacterium]